MTSEIPQWPYRHVGEWQKDPYRATSFLRVVTRYHKRTVFASAIITDEDQIRSEPAAIKQLAEMQLEIANLSIDDMVRWRGVDRYTRAQNQRIQTALRRRARRKK